MVMTGTFTTNDFPVKPPLELTVYPEILNCPHFLNPTSKKISDHSATLRVPAPGSDQAFRRDCPTLLPAAFQEVPAVWMAYLTAVMGNVYGHLTVTQATEQLNNTLDGLSHISCACRHGS